MNKQRLIIGGIIIFIGLLISSFLFSDKDLPTGSVSTGNEYKYTQLSGSLATSSTVIKAEAGTLGSIIITEDSALAVTLYDATSTAALSGSSAYYTKIAVPQAALTEGVYTFDVSFYRGLVLSATDWTAFAGDWTLTWK